MSSAKNKPFLSLPVHDPNYGSTLLKDSSVVSNAAIVVFTSSAAAVLPVLSRQPPGESGFSFGSPWNFYSAFVVCLMFAFACAFTSMVLLLKRPKASRLLHISAAFWLSSAFALLFSALVRKYPSGMN